MQKITPFLWFNNEAEEAARFYVSVFKRSKILEVVRYGGAASKASGKAKGAVMTVKFLLEGQEFVALNGGPHMKINGAISFVVDCKTQREVDVLWEKLSKGGEEGHCAWLRDKFGVSWQIVPAVLMEMLSDKDKVKSERVMNAMLQMGKIDIRTLRQAYRGSYQAMLAARAKP